MKLAADRESVELDVEGAVFVNEGDPNPGPEGSGFPLLDHVDVFVGPGAGLRPSRLGKVFPLLAFSDMELAGYRYSVQFYIQRIVFVAEGNSDPSPEGSGFALRNHENG